MLPRLSRPLLRLFELADPPGLVEPRLQGAIETEQRVPALSGYGLRPVGCIHPLRKARAEPDVDRTVRVGRDSLSGAVDAREALVGLQHRTRLVVVQRERPEVLHWHVGRQAELV